MLTPRARRALFASPWLRDLPDAAREEAAELFEERTVLQGAVLFREGEPGDASYLLVEGAVDLSVEGRHLMRLPPGETFGVALPERDRRRATATAAIDCRLLVLRRENAPKQHRRLNGRREKAGRGDRIASQCELILGTLRLKLRWLW